MRGGSTSTRRAKLDVPMDVELREAVRKRARQLDLNDAQYARHVIRRDLATSNENAPAPLNPAGGMTHTPVEGADDNRE